MRAKNKMKSGNTGQRWRSILHAVLLLLVLLLPTLQEARADVAAGALPGVPVTDQPDGTCTNSPQYNIPPMAPGAGLISTIVTNIRNILTNVSQLMFVSITVDAGFVDMVRGLLTLYIAVYGILFTFGMVQATMYDFVIRMIKIGIIVALISPGAWNFFNNTVVVFFNNGTDELINQFSAIAVGGVAVPPGFPPFAVLDDAVSKAVSAKMAITLMAIFATGPYGAIIGLLLVMALGSFMKSMLNALWVYMMSLVLKTLLFGMAPLFLCCLLFNRTRHLFDGWLNQIVNASLQPVLLFAFFAFFAKLIEACLNNVLAIPVCWTEWAESIRGTPFSQHFWRFASWDADIGTWMPYGGQWTFTGAEGGGPAFPIDIMTILILLILAELAGRFNHIVIEIAKDIAGAATHLGNFSGGIGEWFSSVGAGAGGAAGGRMLPAIGGRATGARPGPGGIGAGGEMYASNNLSNLERARQDAAAMTGTRTS
jgi:type IV secretory pathway VirB6-like protein